MYFISAAPSFYFEKCLKVCFSSYRPFFNLSDTYSIEWDIEKIDVNETCKIIDWLWNGQIVGRCLMADKYLATIMHEKPIGPNVWKLCVDDVFVEGSDY